jgi:acyl-homoserine lactone acylase PvdQ
VYAAPDGTIGWRPAGRVPVRRGWDGTLPVPGDGRFEWDGFLDGRELPAVRDPEQGWFATANQMNLPTDYPNGQRTITYDWYHPYRHDRIAEVVLASLGDAVAEVEQRLGPEPSTWRWGDLHRALLTHPLRALLPPGHEWTQVGPLPRGGSGDTVGSTGYYDGFDQRTGASFRMVVDVGDWDRSVAMNAPGQSGVPTSPHHADLFERWAADEAFPLLYTRAAVEEHLSERFVLRPPG